jgi:hypothetical protein
MKKVLFVPFGVASGVVAGLVARRAFEGVWQVIDKDDPPQSKHQSASLGKLVLASALQGAVFSATRSAADHYSRRAFFRLTGLWPGETESASGTQR